LARRPLIILPGIIFERRFNAERVTAAEAGLSGEKRDLNIAWLRAALARRAEFAPAAADLGERIRACGGPAAAIQAIEAWASS
jgi:UDP:flavonoid glycosyltransferase YjiC (YdhE family)